MRHEPRGSCALTLQNGRLRQLPKMPLYYSAFTIPFAEYAEYAESAENNVRGRRALQPCFFLSWALKYPVSRVLLRI